MMSSPTPTPTPRDPLPEDVEVLTLDGVRDAVMQQLHAGNIEVRGASCRQAAAEGAPPPARSALARVPSPRVGRGRAAAMGVGGVVGVGVGVRVAEGGGGGRGPAARAPGPTPPPPGGSIENPLDLKLSNRQVNIVGDFESQELEQLCLAYLGTVAPSEGAVTPADRCVGPPLPLAPAALPTPGERSCRPSLRPAAGLVCGPRPAAGEARPLPLSRLLPCSWPARQHARQPGPGTARRQITPLAAPPALSPGGGGRSRAPPRSSSPLTPPTSRRGSAPRPVVFAPEVPAGARHQAWHLRDSDERACAYIAGQAPCRWGPLGSRAPLPPLEGPILPPPELPPRATAAEVAAAREQRRKHPLYASITLELLKEVGLAAARPRAGRGLTGAPGANRPPHLRALALTASAAPPPLPAAPPRPLPSPGHQQPALHDRARQPRPHLRCVLRGHDV
jgi:hypothetical protein